VSPQPRRFGGEGVYTMPEYCPFCGERGHWEKKTLKAHNSCTSLDWGLRVQ